MKLLVLLFVGLILTAQDCFIVCPDGRWLLCDSSCGIGTGTPNCPGDPQCGVRQINCPGDPECPGRQGG
jgi:hypothetical protein